MHPRELIGAARAVTLLRGRDALEHVALAVLADRLGHLLGEVLQAQRARAQEASKLRVRQRRDVAEAPRPELLTLRALEHPAVAYQNQLRAAQLFGEHVHRVDHGGRVCAVALVHVHAHRLALRVRQQAHHHLLVAAHDEWSTCAHQEWAPSRT